MLPPLVAWIDDDNDAQTRTMSGPELLDGSEFLVATAAGENDGTMLTVWGRAPTGALTAGLASLRSTVTWPAARWAWTTRAGHGWPDWRCRTASAGAAYAQPSNNGKLSSALTGAFPYVGFEVVPERLSLWAAGGYGLGRLQLDPDSGDALETPLNLLGGAGGVRGTMVPASATGGFSLGVNADGLLLQTTSEEAAGLGAVTARVNQGRLGLEGSYEVALGGGARLTPSVEAGARRDGLDAEIGFGMDVGRRAELHATKRRPLAGAERASDSISRNRQGGGLGRERLAGVGSESGFAPGTGADSELIDSART